MAELTTTQFTDFFQAVHGYEPFEWQKCFANEVLEDKGWPDVVHVPTGCGKTSVLDLAVFELALRAKQEPEQRNTARRICFVVDRRLVVDEAAEHARCIRKAIISAAKGERDEPVLKAVAEQLARLASDPAAPLRVVRLRGGVYRYDGWAVDPLTPTILVSTVDQVGSRLLFRGYGVSERSRPVHAGLLAFDTRIILDEAHLSMVFAETLDRVRQYQQCARQSPLPRNRLVSLVRMSATAGEARQPFKLTDDMRNDKRLEPRLKARKRTSLIEVKVESTPKKMRDEQPRKASDLELENRKKLVERLVQEAKKLAGLIEGSTITQDNPPRVFGIVVNRVATARQVFEQLRKRGDNEPEREAILLTGRIRPYDRDRLLDEWLPKIKVGRGEKPEHPLFVVATQTVEVGANLDFDALITEAAPLDSLRQRFGRLDRLGIRHQLNLTCPALILIRSDQILTAKRLKELDDQKDMQDPIYGNAIAHTWNYLKENAMTEGGAKSKSVWIDFGINHLDMKLPKDREKLQRMLAPQQEAPLLFPAHLDAWVQTNPMPVPDPDVAPFLHGRADATADVQVVWRADIDKDNHKDWGDIVRLMPPRTREALPVPIYELRAWLRKEAGGEIADVEGVRLYDEDDRRKRNGLQVLRWRGTKDIRVIGSSDVKPGDTIVVPAAYGGADELGWNPSNLVPVAPVTDIAEACLAQIIASYPPDAFRRPKLRFRIHPSLFEGIGTSPAIKQRLNALLRTALTVAEADEADMQPSIQRLLSALKEHVSHTTLRAAIEVLLKTPQPQVKLYPQDEGLVVVAAVALPEESAVPAEDSEHEDPEGDAASLVPNGRKVLLQEHIVRIEKKVAEFARHCGLGVDLQRELTLAARWHDEGKRDRRFQAWLYGSELKSLTALAAGQTLAKSGRNAKEDSRFGYPRGARHEFVSVRLFEAACKGNGGNGPHDIVKLLIGTHHGHGRPFAPAVPESEESHPIQVATNHEGKKVAVSSDHRMYRLDSGWTDLFWRMVRLYGCWGLSYLEALVITADHIVSAQEQQPANQMEESTI